MRMRLGDMTFMRSRRLRSTCLMRSISTASTRASRRSNGYSASIRHSCMDCRASSSTPVRRHWMSRVSLPMSNDIVTPRPRHFHQGRLRCQVEAGVHAEVPGDEGPRYCGTEGLVLAERWSWNLAEGPVAWTCSRGCCGGDQPSSDRPVVMPRDISHSLLSGTGEYYVVADRRSGGAQGTVYDPVQGPDAAG